MTRYSELATLFRRRIDTGEWNKGEQIPTLDELAVECGVARETIRRALDILEQQGLIARYRAKGTFVTGEPREQLWCELKTDFFGILQAREGMEIRLVSETRRAPVGGPLEFGVAAPAYRHLRRIHSLKGVPYLSADVYIDERIAAQIPRAAFTNKTALRLLADVADIDIVDVEQIMTIGAADLALAETLQMPLNAPVAWIDRYALGPDGQLLLFARGAYRGDVVRLSIKLTDIASLRSGG